MSTKKFILSLLILFSLPIFAQRIDNTAIYRQVPSSKYFRFHYDNDYFTATDYYYTQGYNFEWMHPALKKNPLSKTLIKLKHATTNYGLSFENFGFTPTSLYHSEILYGDRPFAACILLKVFSISTDADHKLRLSAAISTGMIGPVALGHQIQQTIHSWINGVNPQGWNHQIRNDIIINYQLALDKELFTHQNLFSVYANSKAQIGTLNDNVQVGFTMMAGKHISPFQTIQQSNNFQLYFYTQPLMNLVMYDASLQGGLFNHTSDYTITANQLSRITFQENFGAVFTYKKIFLEYNQSILSKEFSTGLYHRWGGVTLGYIF